jgi:hypothetical protein
MAANGSGADKLGEAERRIADRPAPVLLIAFANIRRVASTRPEMQVKRG